MDKGDATTLPFRGFESSLFEQEAVGEDATLELGVKLLGDELWERLAGLLFDLLREGVEMLLDDAVSAVFSGWRGW